MLYMKELLRRLVPISLWHWCVKQRILYNQRKLARIQIKRDELYSNTFNKSKSANLSLLMATSHVLEKGLTMPNPHLGFGFEMIRSVGALCEQCIELYGSKHLEIQATLADLNQYNELHKCSNYNLPKDIQDKLDALIPYLTIKDGNCYEANVEDFFKPATSFYEFAYQRHTLRWFSDREIERDTLNKVFKLAQTAPSACNRQSTRVKVISDKDKIIGLTEIQNGNRGFGYMANKWILLTSEQSNWECGQQDMAYIDVGIFAMNLLYALHYYGIAACTLNAHLSLEKQNRLRNLLGLPETEIPCLFMAIGYPPTKFMVARSRRLELESIVSYL